MTPKKQEKSASRRGFLGGLVAAGAAAQPALNASAHVTGFDHVALPMQDTSGMLAFYRSLGFTIAENPTAISVYMGRNMINFHRPATWQREGFTLRAPAAKPPCGDLCFVWDGTPDQLKAWLDGANVKVIEGPVARQGGRRKGASSVYVRDPDGNLLEFLIYQ
jgi:catechol 2,3-dioxygenase-like lactoylglutathione lyase family enzyme